MGGNWQLGVDLDVFLDEYWQRKPLLIRSGSAHFSPPLDSDALAGLALEEEVESRLIEQTGDTWKLQHGPFDAADFSREHPWTLLVQAVDHYIPEVADLQRLFDFIPRWRMDDVMASYAVDGGSAGPHYDNYDVFLLQGEGQKLWRLGQHCDSTCGFLPLEDMRILDRFDISAEYLLGPGDILYVPPGLAHWGIARGESTTFSIGFRAPAINDMIARWTDQLLLHADAGQFFRDARRSTASLPGEIHAIDIAHALAQLRHALDQPMNNHWFGELVTEPRYDTAPDENSLAPALQLLRNGARRMWLCPAAKLAWQRDEQGLTAFANGDSLACGVSALPSLLTLCNRRELAGADLDNALADPDTAQLLECLLQNGCIDVE